jgi:hypothetical protein
MSLIQVEINKKKNMMKNTQKKLMDDSFVNFTPFPRAFK